MIKILLRIPVIILVMIISKANSANELALGSEVSPVTFIEYGSLTCDHCIGFHRKILPALKSQYVDAGKMRFIYRHYPTSKIALQAALAAECSGDKYYEMLDLLYLNIRDWYAAKDKPKAFQEKALDAGVDIKTYSQCLNDKSIEKRVLEQQKEAFREYDVHGTPTFIINGKVVKGEHSLEDLKKIIDKALTDK